MKEWEKRLDDIEMDSAAHFAHMKVQIERIEAQIRSIQLALPRGIPAAAEPSGDDGGEK